MNNYIWGLIFFGLLFGYMLIHVYYAVKILDLK